MRSLLALVLGAGVVLGYGSALFSHARHARHAHHGHRAHPGHHGHGAVHGHDAVDDHGPHGSDPGFDAHAPDAPVHRGSSWHTPAPHDRGLHDASVPWDAQDRERGRHGAPRGDTQHP